MATLDNTLVFLISPLGILGYDIFLNKNGDVQHNLTVMEFNEDIGMISLLTAKPVNDSRDISKLLYSY